MNAKIGFVREVERGVAAVAQTVAGREASPAPVEDAVPALAAEAEALVSPARAQSEKSMLLWASSCPNKSP